MVLEGLRGTEAAQGNHQGRFGKGVRILGREGEERRDLLNREKGGAIERERPEIRAPWRRSRFERESGCTKSFVHTITKK